MTKGRSEEVGERVGCKAQGGSRKAYLNGGQINL